MRAPFGQNLKETSRARAIDTISRRLFAAGVIRSAEKRSPASEFLVTHVAAPFKAAGEMIRKRAWKSSSKSGCTADLRAETEAQHKRHIARAGLIPIPFCELSIGIIYARRYQISNPLTRSHRPNSLDEVF